jgi:hypothetical protein
MHFPANAGLIFLTDESTNYRYLVDTGATLSIVTCSQNASPSGPLSKGQMGNLSPHGALLKTLQFQSKLFTATFLQAAVADPILGIDIFKKFKVTAFPEINQIQFACSAAASPAPHLPSAALPAHPLFFFQRPRQPRLFYLAQHRSQLRFQFRCPLRRLLHSLLL